MADTPMIQIQSAIYWRIWKVYEAFVTEQIDALDRRILSVLQSEGRISMTELGDRVGLSTSPCARRVKRLEDEDISPGMWPF